jgi:hypothetical protein
VFESAVEWLDPVPVRLLPAAPRGLVTAAGGRQVGIEGAVRGRRASVSGVVLAWAPVPGRGWACLLAWSGMRSIGPRPRVSARWSWCWIGRQETYVHIPTPPDNPWGLAWYGNRNEDLDAAIEEAVGSLPPPMRQAAARPLPRDQPLRLASVNPRVLWTPPARGR